MSQIVKTGTIELFTGDKATIYSYNGHKFIIPSRDAIEITDFDDLQEKFDVFIVLKQLGFDYPYYNDNPDCIKHIVHITICDDNEYNEYATDIISVSYIYDFGQVIGELNVRIKHYLEYDPVNPDPIRFTHDEYKVKTSKVIDFILDRFPELRPMQKFPPQIAD